MYFIQNPATLQPTTVDQVFKENLLNLNSLKQNLHPQPLFKKGSFAAYFKHFQATLRVDPVAQSVITGWLEEPRRAVALLWAPSGDFQAWPRLLQQLRGMQRPKAQNGRCFFWGGEGDRRGDEEMRSFRYVVWMMGLNDRMMGWWYAWIWSSKICTKWTIRVYLHLPGPPGGCRIPGVLAHRHRVKLLCGQAGM